jgi:3D (Asp-Asp-Asp) domain-containing protein
MIEVKTIYIFPLVIGLSFGMAKDYVANHEQIVSAESGQVLSAMDPIGNNAYVSTNQARLPETRSNFEHKEEMITEEIAYPTEEVYTDELFIGESEVDQEGKSGVLTEKYDVWYWAGEEFSRDLVLTETQDPVTRIVRIGTRRRYQKMDTPTGEIEYYQVARMWSTSYDGFCVGCSGRTATGTSVKHGVCAVDPRVIPLGSWIYVPGYGKCHAEDTGGAIKGNKIDLGFENVRQGWWSSRYTDVYFLK